MSSSRLIASLKKSLSFHPVVPFDAAKDRLLSMDFTKDNKDISEDMLYQLPALTAYIEGKLSDAGARYGIGGYAEHRTIYSSSKVFDADRPGEEPRRLHLGTDIWGKAYTPVMAPLNGIVHSFAFNNQPGDYGATILLSHALEENVFFTLYGHLSLNSIKNIREGDRVEKGDTIAAFGIPAENGQWPPHLHFQLVEDIREWKGDYPGVCKFSEKEKWLANSPDPDLILQMNRYIKQ